MKRPGPDLQESVSHYTSAMSGLFKPTVSRETQSWRIVPGRTRDTGLLMQRMVLYRSWMKEERPLKEHLWDNQGNVNLD